MRSRIALFSVVTAVAVGVASCGGSSATPTVASVLAPSSTATVTGLTLNLSTPGVGATVNAQGVVTLSTGNAITLSSGYSSDTPSVAAVSATGGVTGIAIGDATIAVEYQGFKATRKIHVLPNYAGTFFGNYTIDGCVDSAGFTDIGFCASFTGLGLLPIAFSNTQSADLTTLGGLFALGDLQGTTTGAIAADGKLTFTGGFSSGTTTMTFRDFVVTSQAVGHMQGTFKAVFVDSATSGGATWICTMTDAIRTAGGVLPAVRAGRPAGVPSLIAALTTRR